MILLGQIYKKTKDERLKTNNFLVKKKRRINAVIDTSLLIDRRINYILLISICVIDTSLLIADC